MGIFDLFNSNPSSAVSARTCAFQEVSRTLSLGEKLLFFPSISFGETSRRIRKLVLCENLENNFILLVILAGCTYTMYVGPMLVQLISFKNKNGKPRFAFFFFLIPTKVRQLIQEKKTESNNENNELLSCQRGPEA